VRYGKLHVGLEIFFECRGDSEEYLGHTLTLNLTPINAEISLPGRLQEEVA